MITETEAPDTNGDDRPDPIRAAVGAAVREARHRAGLSMREFAASCGVSQPFVSAIERGLSTPSIATLYRMAEVLELDPADLLPPHPTDGIEVIRAGDGPRVPSSDRPGSAIGRILLTDTHRHLEIYEYVTNAGEDLDVWYEHPGDVILHLIDGHLRVELRDRPDVELGPGDCVVHPGPIPHRWTVIGDDQVRLFLVVVRQRP
ncbi:MAG: XRE family transcriptional regulator [Actinomycetota bacterium]